MDEQTTIQPPQRTPARLPRNSSRRELLQEIAWLSAQVKRLEIEAIDEHMLRIGAEVNAERESLGLAMTVHELRTPLSGIVGFASTILAADLTWTEDEIEQFVIIIADEANKMRTLLDDLVEATRTKAVHSKIQRAPVSVTDILTIAKTPLKVVAPHHKVAEVIPENLPMALADRQRIAQVLVNLVRNAAEHSPLDTTIRIAASTEEQTMIRIDVTDEGEGILGNAWATVFAAFKRGDNAPAEGSNMGLGLTICKAIIEAHGGRIWAEDGVERGTRLSFTLPAV